MIEVVVYHVHGLIEDDLDTKFDMLILQVLKHAL